MENCNNNKEHHNQHHGVSSEQSEPLENISRITFEYSFPTSEPSIDDDDDTSSNKSTPFYTPLEFFQGSFEFPSPKLEKSATTSATATVITPPFVSPAPPPPTQFKQKEDEKPSSTITLSTSIGSEISEYSRISQLTPGKPFPIVGVKQQLQNQSPALGRKFRRFSLYDRRSCSPQNYLVKNTSADIIGGTSEIEEYVDDKENAKPASTKSEKVEETLLLFVPNSGNNSPIILTDENTSSPKVLQVSNDVRMVYSPKLLASINNLNLSGSPLNVISSAGYKNGNYFKFPEIDQMVQGNTSLITSTTTTTTAIAAGSITTPTTENDSYTLADNQNRLQKQNSSSSSSGSSSTSTSASISTNSTTNTSNNINIINTSSTNNVTNSINNTTSFSEPTIKTNLDEEKHLQKQQQQQQQNNELLKRNRKNKNNLTIKITDVPCPQFGQQKSPSPKIKTPTIKNTKEKALSLDSAATDNEPKKVTFGTSCDEIDSHGLKLNVSRLRQRRVQANEKNQSVKNIITGTNLSNSMSLLMTSGELQTPQVFISKPGTNIIRTPRRRVPGPACNDWIHYHRKQNPYTLSIDSAKRSGNSDNDGSEKCFFDNEVIVLHEDDEVLIEDNKDIEQLQSAKSSTSSSLTPSSARNSFKHSPLLHSSSTNLKTLPEFVPLMEFTANNPEHRASPFKQKSMELPSSNANHLQHHPQIQHPSTAMTNLSTTSTLHTHTKNVTTSSSSTNLLQRRGSNHSLTLNLHGSCSNLLGSCRNGLSVSNYSLGSMGNSTTNLNSTQVIQVQPSINSSLTTSQNAKQSLFRRRGSNYSLTQLNLSATSCGNLNSFASQNSLNVDKCGVTRTTSFVTPTTNQNTTSVLNTTPKRGLLERRGSNQSLTLNMANVLGHSNTHLNETHLENKLNNANHCNIQSHNNSHSHQRKFFSSESLNKPNAPFGDLNQAHKRNANQVCFGSVSDLKPNDPHLLNVSQPSAAVGKRDHFDFNESSVCTCTGVRNIMTRPLSPQATSEEFKIYLAGIQLLQNSSNPLSQEELIKLNFIFDNSYATKKSMIEQPLPSLLNMHHNKEAETPPGLVYTSEDFEVVARYEEVVRDIINELKPSDEEQKRMFCNLHKEFWDLPLNHQEKPMVFGSQTKNRYKTILPNENSRVILDKEECKNDDLTKVKFAFGDKNELSNNMPAEEQPYINANYIKGPDYNSKCYVATQGPLPNTIFEFWLMIFQNTQKYIHERKNFDLTSSMERLQEANLKQYYQKIVMLTNFLENNRQKCSIYFPVELNEIYVTQSRDENAHLSEGLKEYFNTYLMPLQDTEFTDSSTMEQTLKVEAFTPHLPQDLLKDLPKDNNFFVIKNVGIVKKNGFSIRKLVVLYCIQNNDKKQKEVTTTTTAVTTNKLLIYRIYCYHYWYPDWPDHRSPKDINALLDICLHILNLGKCESEFDCFNHLQEEGSLKAYLVAQKLDLYQHDVFNAVQPLPVIHCSAGIGRTGCLTAILNAIRQLRQSLAYSLTTLVKEFIPKLLNETDLINFEDIFPFNKQLFNDTDSSFTRNTLIYVIEMIRRCQPSDVKELKLHDQLPSLKLLPKLPELYVDCLGIVCNLRLQRGGMVQNSEQYELIHRAICLYMKRTYALKRF